ncbi:hypothetical protein V8G54_011089 [Vigna mungo]|uniref:CCT domain-containing protein n=1 Tax=Vigna mungo TaxID=3915 RepID=A0AAQ3NS01_VIGMU
MCVLNTREFSLYSIVPFDYATAATNACAPDNPDVVVWLIPNPNFGLKFVDVLDIKSNEIFYSEIDPFLDFDYSNFFHNNNSKNDNVVPVQTKPSLAPSLINNHQQSESCFDIDFCRTKLSSFNYPSQSLRQSVSTTIHGVGREHRVEDVVLVWLKQFGIEWYWFVRSKWRARGDSVVWDGTEKRKYRKFEKTIRYASRKAYVETQPKIKGSFAKRAEIDSDLDIKEGTMVGWCMNLVLGNLIIMISDSVGLIIREKCEESVRTLFLPGTRWGRLLH